MEVFEIKDHTLEYDDDTHTYLVDGIIVPSITQILKVRFGGKYAGVDKDTMQRAAQRGTDIHKAIELYCREQTESNYKELHNYKFLAKHHNFTVARNEVPIILCKFGDPIAAGRLDLVLDMCNTGDKALADIKTTSTLDKEYLAYQLNLYRLGYMQSYDEEITKLYGVHLRDDKRKFVEIPINEGIAWDIVGEYERGKHE